MAELLLMLAVLLLGFLTSPSCNCCGGGSEFCELCQSLTENRDFRIVLPTIEEFPTPACGDCDEWTGTHDVAVDPSSSSTHCVWSAPLSCDETLWLRFYYDGVSSFTTRIQAGGALLAGGTGSNGIVWQLDHGNVGSIDCSAFSATAIGFVGQSNGNCRHTSGDDAVLTSL